MTTSRLGLLALAFYLAHAAFHVIRGTAGDLLWACNVAVPSIALGCFLAGSRPRLASLCAVTGFLWLTYGLPMWLLDISTGGDFIPTSLLTHVGGTVIGAVAVRRLGWPRRAWLFASAATLVLVLVTRALGSPARNANLVFRIHDGWERWFPSHALYLAVMWTGSALVFFVIELFLRAPLSRRAESA